MVASGCLMAGNYHTAKTLEKGTSAFGMTFSATKYSFKYDSTTTDPNTGQTTTEKKSVDFALPNLLPELTYHIGVSDNMEAGGRVSLGSLGGGGTVVVDMNESAVVTGTSLTASGEQHAFVWTAARGMVDLGTGPAGFRCAWVVGISFGGDIVGYTAQEGPSVHCASPSQTRAVLWRKTSK